MYNKKAILGLYNSVSEVKIDQNELLTILPKLYLIINKTKLNEIDIINTIDVLEEIKKNGELNKINPELIDLIIKIVPNDRKDKKVLKDSLYFHNMLKYVVLPYNKSICNQKHDLLIFLSEFEIFIQLAGKMLNRKDLFFLDKYTHELKEVIIKYKESMTIYRQWVINDIILSQMISHFASMFYFNIEDFDEYYDLIIELLARCISNYQEFIDYCCSLGIHKNFTGINVDLIGIELEYITSYDMLKYIYNYLKNNEKVKRK